MSACRRVFHWLVRACLLLAVGVLSIDRAGAEALREARAVPRDPATGIMRGAAPVHMDRGRSGACLLLHGWLSTPADFGDLPEALDEAGWDVYAPLHAGHGTEPADLGGVSARELLEGARAHYAELRGRYEEVVLIGFSMGGTIASILAAEQPPDKLVLVAPFYRVEHKWYYVLPPRWWRALLSGLVRYVRGSPRLVRVNRPEGRDEVVAYAAFPTSALDALFAVRDRAVEQTDLSGLRMPVLLIYSTGDDVSSPPAMERYFEKLPSRQKRKEVFSRSNHIILHDYDREEAIRAIVGFLGRP